MRILVTGGSGFIGKQGGSMHHGSMPKHRGYRGSFNQVLSDAGFRRHIYLYIGEGPDVICLGCGRLFIGHILKEHGVCEPPLWFSDKDGNSPDQIWVNDDRLMRALINMAHGQVDADILANSDLSQEIDRLRTENEAIRQAANITYVLVPTEDPSCPLKAEAALPDGKSLGEVVDDYLKNSGS